MSSPARLILLPPGGDIPVGTGGVQFTYNDCDPEGRPMARKKGPPQERAFLDDILPQPEDDTVRRIYADWLDDQGQAHRGEFIRVQCELANLAEDDPRRAGLLEREWELLAVYRDAWSLDL